MADSFIVGDVAYISLALSDLSGAPADPGALRLRVKAPDGTLSTYTYGGGPQIVRDGTGIYHAEVALDAAGAWHFRWESDAPNPGAAEGALVARASRVL